MNNIKENIIKQIEKGEEKAPFLFLGNNSEINNSKVHSLAMELLEKYNIPKSYLYTLNDDGEKIKIKEIKDFIEFSNSKPPYKFQIFLIENISRLTISSSNSLLKFFEEPDSTNIILLTNQSESGIMETILSRVQTFNLGGQGIIKKDNFIQSMINNYISKKDPEILSYYFRNKLEKTDYISFLENLIIFSKENLVLINFLDEINEDINSIISNNVNGKYIIDKWLMRI